MALLLTSVISTVPIPAPRLRFSNIVLLAAILTLPVQLLAQNGANVSKEDDCGPAHLKTCLKDVLNDQAGIFTSPLRINKGDLPWLLPLAGATGLALAYDEDALREVGPPAHGRTLIDVGDAVSGFGSPEATLGEAGVLYAIGAVTKDQKLRRTGILGVEAIVDVSIVTEAIKLATNRQRPNQGDGSGDFWAGGASNYSLDSSFPSGHTSSSWALARVVASEYHGWLPKVGAYSFASLISANRITSRSHFPSDVVVGSALGYLVGGYVVRHHSDASQQSSLVVLPVYDGSSRSYGVAVSFTPHTPRWLGSSQ